MIPPSVSTPAKPAPDYHEREQRLPLAGRALGVRFFEMRDQPVSQFDGVVESFDSQRYLLNPRQAEEIRARTERDYQMVVGEFVDVEIEAMGDGDASPFEVYRFYVPREGLGSPEQLAKRIDDGVHFEIARRYLVQHRREKKVVVARHQRDAHVGPAVQSSFQFHRGVDAAEPAAKYQDPVGAICACAGLGAASVFIFGLIQIDSSTLEPLKVPDCSIA